MPDPQRISTFSNDGLSFEVRDEGPLDGPPIILLHGFPDGPASWDRVVPLLVAQGRRVLVPAQRGYSPGARPQGRRDYRLELLARDVLALAEAAGAARFDLLVHDWGGGPGWYLGASRPDVVRTLTVLSTPHPRAMLRAMTHSTQALKSWYMGMFQLPALPELSVRAAGGRNFVKSLQGMGLPEEEARDARDLLLQPGAATGAINWYRAIPWSRLHDTGPVTVPTLYVYSTGDKALGRYAAEHTGDWVTGPYRYEVLAGVAHFIPTEAPEVVADLVDQWITDATA